MEYDRLIGTVAHELRNPLAPLKNAIELMGASPDVPARQAQSLGISLPTVLLELLDALAQALDAALGTRLDRIYPPSADVADAPEESTP